MGLPEIAGAREKLSWAHEPFVVPDDVLKSWRAAGELLAEKGTWVRVRRPPVEGRVERGYEGLRVGDTIRVKLIRTDPARGFIDFVRV